MPLGISISNSIGSQTLSSGIAPRESRYLVQQDLGRISLNQVRTDYLVHHG